jgi:hypothetical protein
VGLAEAQRSHFEAQDLCERGGARPGAHPQGWLARALASGPTEPSAFRAFAFEEVEDLRVPGGPGAGQEALRRLFEPRVSGDDPTSAIARAGRDALDAVERLRAASGDGPRGRAGFEGRLGRQLETVARVARADLGLVAAYVDAQGWDPHIRQGAEEGALARAAGELARGLAAFLRALEDRMDDLLVLVVTEFGRTPSPTAAAAPTTAAPARHSLWAARWRAAGCTAAGRVRRPTHARTVATCASPPTCATSWPRALATSERAISSAYSPTFHPFEPVCCGPAGSRCSRLPTSRGEAPPDTSTCDCREPGRRYLAAAPPRSFRNAA